MSNLGWLAQFGSAVHRVAVLASLRANRVLYVDTEDEAHQIREWGREAGLVVGVMGVGSKIAVAKVG